MLTYVDLIAKRGFCSLVAGGLLLCAGCETTSDPNVDSIGFSPERAEGEQIAPRRARLAREEEGGEAERIRALTLKRQSSEATGLPRSNDAAIRRLRAQRQSRVQELAVLKQQVAAAQSQGRQDRELIDDQGALIGTVAVGRSRRWCRRGLAYRKVA